MFLTFLISFTARDELLDAFIHQYLSKLILGDTNVELSLRS